jgi:glycosyltransferase involved in cell wall biosynthesis
MFCNIVAPARRSVHIDVIGWGLNAESKLGNPTHPENRWNGQINVTLHPHLYSPEETAPFFNRSHVLLHYYPVVESFGYATLQAMAAGVVVIGAPVGGFADLISPGHTGIFASTPDEASYWASEMCWRPKKRNEIARNAYQWLFQQGPANADLAWPWWNTLIKRA